ncbi:hypothetical protein Hanom_Chr15g01403331 [Helianthus anomalus]
MFMITTDHIWLEQMTMSPSQDHEPPSCSAAEYYQILISHSNSPSPNTPNHSSHLRSCNSLRVNPNSPRRNETPALESRLSSHRNRHLPATRNTSPNP